MIKYYIKNDNLPIQIAIYETPSYYERAIKENWQEITKEKYDDLQSTSEDDFKYYDAEMQEAEWKEEEKEDATDLSYLYEEEAVKSNSSDVTEPVEEVVMPIAKNPHRL